MAAAEDSFDQIVDVVVAGSGGGMAGASMLFSHLAALDMARNGQTPEPAAGQRE